MKTFIALFFLFYCSRSFSQNFTNLTRIDSLVTTINASKLKITQDSIIQNMPDIGLFMKTYLSMIMDGRKLNKYVNYVKATQVESRVAKQMTTCNTFYFQENNLIKVEECVMTDYQMVQFVWYFSEDKCLYHSLQSDKADSRASLLLSMGKDFVKKISPGSN
jgi:hypothetical protein